jgi:acetoin utilization deacetylase AcuC-like enzyme
MTAVVQVSQVVAFSGDAHELHSPPWILMQGERRESPERPERARKLRAALEQLGVEARSPLTVDDRHLLVVHTRELIDHLSGGWALAQVAGRAEVVVPDVFRHARLRPAGGRVHADVHAAAGELCFDCSSPLLEGTWPAALESAALAICGARALLEGAPLVYALCRPPGHHAGPDFYGGFCYLNNAALAACQLGRAAILDIDVHHGNGTQAVFWDDREVLTVSVHEDPAYAFPYFTGYADEGARPT